MISWVKTVLNKLHLSDPSTIQELQCNSVLPMARTSQNQIYWHAQKATSVAVGPSPLYGEFWIHACRLVRERPKFYYVDPPLALVSQNVCNWWLIRVAWVVSFGFFFPKILGGVGDLRSGRSRIFLRGYANSQKCYYFSIEIEVKTYYSISTIFSPKTAWKWKNLDP